MPLAEVRFHRLAVKEFREARRWYAAQSAHTGTRFADAVEKALDRIARAPESCAIERDDYRRIRVTRFPYTAIFRPRSERLIMIVAIAHASRRPGYWHRRQ
jgi:toxin ParE1/3/4